MRQDVIFNDLDHARIDCFVNDHEGLSIHRIDPVIRGCPQTEFLSGNVVTRKFGLLSIVNPDMTINIKGTCLFWCALHPFFTECFTPLLWTFILCELFDFTPQGADFWNAIQTNQFAPFSWRTIAQRFNGLYPNKCDKGQYDEQAV
ncbi:hypothetical protein BPLS_P0078 [Bathymodiolus platifrons methanotrophic gill symbiont]|nr:hypothetical protein BPLS_P0078 [Bathymodiolus platifrons methanotrophic gill symbiont]